MLAILSLLVPHPCVPMQFMWGSNASSPAQPPTGYVLTDSGQLLEGRLGGKLMPVPHVHANASCAAVAPNGQLIALGAADGVTVQALARPSEFYASIATQVICITSHTMPATSCCQTQRMPGPAPFIIPNG